MQAACELVRSGEVKLATRQLRSYTAPSTNILEGWQWLRAQQLCAYDAGLAVAARSAAVRLRRVVRVQHPSLEEAECTR
ncbi:hypothetical protein HYH02_015339 [Chlamydomonas schloesseri]|uniref:Uncharacterized protein n=1 Tax=Chlamydomonas schloesseri TaxID=2026947 RepID=A0A835S9U5_9CHLO|nr:hypothetical protein HYH02_015339 [Chlamydomonas schloesseri]|eukprot:KAG2423367.1 hypothetical protein HYH02_015339 [Chlamydomonas schloesseri]